MEHVLRNVRKRSFCKKGCAKCDFTDQEGSASVPGSTACCGGIFSLHACGLQGRLSECLADRISVSCLRADTSCKASGRGEVRRGLSDESDDLSDCHFFVRVFLLQVYSRKRTAAWGGVGFGDPYCVYRSLPLPDDDTISRRSPDGILSGERPAENLGYNIQKIEKCKKIIVQNIKVC